MARRTLPIVTSAASECALRTEGEKMAACETEYHTEVHTGEAQYETWRELREIREITATDRKLATLDVPTAGDAPGSASGASKGGGQ